MGIDSNMNMHFKVKEPVIPGVWKVYLGIDNFPTTAYGAYYTTFPFEFTVSCQDTQEEKEGACVPKSDEPDEGGAGDKKEGEKPGAGDKEEEREIEEEAKPVNEEKVEKEVIVEQNENGKFDYSDFEEEEKLFDELLDLMQIYDIEEIIIEDKLKKTTKTFDEKFRDIGTGDLRDFELNVGNVYPAALRSYVKYEDGQLVILPISAKLTSSYGSVGLELRLDKYELRKIKTFELIFTEVKEETLIGEIGEESLKDLKGEEGFEDLIGEEGKNNS